MNNYLNISSQLYSLKNEIEKMIQNRLKKIDDLIDFNQAKLLNSFKNNRVSGHHFMESTGYGHNDFGRETLENIYAEVFASEAAIVRPHIVSGTHAISCVFFGLLRPGDHMLYITGKPYDSLEKVIESDQEGNYSLSALNIKTTYVNLKDDCFDYEAIINNINSTTKIIAIQRSRGYSNRKAITIQQIEKIVTYCKDINDKLIVFVDNCYGEFTEINEPCAVGVDVIAGSLIKNPGGGIVRSGGYIVGKEKYVDVIAQVVTCPSVGKSGGAMLGTVREFYQGLFLAPHVVGQALKGAVFAAAVLEQLNIKTDPIWCDDDRSDIIQAIHFNDKEKLIKFCQLIQEYAPVDSHVKPIAGDMPGYADQVIMAAGTFIQGSSIELGADAPLREPYSVYMQGGLTYSHSKIAFLQAIDKLM